MAASTSTLHLLLLLLTTALLHRTSSLPAGKDEPETLLSIEGGGVEGEEGGVEEELVGEAVKGEPVRWDGRAFRSCRF